MTVQGADALQRKLASIPAKLTEAVRAELEKQAQIVVDMMKRLAPTGRTRRLVNSINWTWGDAPAGTMTIGTVKTAKGPINYGTMRITIYAGGDKAFYARFQEFGTKNMVANPFFFPAYRAKKKSMKSALTRSMRKALKNG